MKKHSKRQTTNGKARREFLRHSAIAGAGATIATTLPGAAMAEDSEKETVQPDENYRLTRHISDYYKTLA